MLAGPALDADLVLFLRRVEAGEAAFDRSQGIDPHGLTAEKALRLGLPPPPDRDDPAYPLWYTLANAHSLSPVKARNVRLGEPSTGYNRLGLGGHMETSRNWSGAVITAPYRDRPFHTLYGTWKVPDFRPSANHPSDHYAVSTWIGFDGHRRGSRSLPQIGIVQEIEKNFAGVYERTIKAWWQWWWKCTDGPHYFDPIEFPIEVGDTIVASLFINPTVGVQMNLVNGTTGVPIEPIIKKPPNVDLAVLALDAECVLERPTPFPPPIPPAPLKNFVVPDFDDTTFKCFALSYGASTSRDMRGARIIRMVHNGWDNQIETIAAPIREARSRFVTVRYCGR